MRKRDSTRGKIKTSQKIRYAKNPTIIILKREHSLLLPIFFVGRVCVCAPAHIATLFPDGMNVYGKCESKNGMDRENEWF